MKNLSAALQLLHVYRRTDGMSDFNRRSANEPKRERWRAEPWKSGKGEKINKIEPVEAEKIKEIENHGSKKEISIEKQKTDTEGWIDKREKKKTEE
jgi:hypothetical protein